MKKEISPKGVLFRWSKYLPLTADTPRFSLGEGDTPLVRSESLASECGLDELWFKLESCNPTGSFKDRGMVVAVARAIEAGSDPILCASTGNTSASAAAYAARCGLRAIILIPGGRIAAGKLSQAIAFGAHIVEVEGNFDHALQLARELSEKYAIELVNSVNPFRIEGQKTAAYEICEELGDAPDVLAIPVGNAGNITAYWKGFQECYNLEFSTQLPRMTGFQAAGAAPIVQDQQVPDPQTIASAIRIGNPASWKGAVDARDQSGGLIASVTDDEIVEAYELLARREGLFVEPASAASLAGLRKIAKQGLSSGGVGVSILTGNGLKDPETASKFEPAARMKLPDSLEAAAETLGLSDRV